MMDKTEKVETETLLTGGQMTAVVRIGETVRRATGAWTPAVHQLLRHLEAVGFDGAPRVLGHDAASREILTFIDGDAGFFDRTRIVPPNLWSNQVLTEAARLLRRYHDATVGFVPADGSHWQLLYPDRTRHEVICHNDFAPYNCIFRDGHLRAMIDFDVACPGARAWDLAYAAYTFVPLYRDEGCRDVGLRMSPDRTHRLRLFCDAYGLEERSGFLETIEQRVQAVIKMIVDAAASGDVRFQRKVTEGHVTGYEANLAYIRQDREQLQRAI